MSKFTLYAGIAATPLKADTLAEAKKEAMTHLPTSCQTGCRWDTGAIQNKTVLCYREGRNWMSTKFFIHPSK